MAGGGPTLAEEQAEAGGEQRPGNSALGNLGFWLAVRLMWTRMVFLGSTCHRRYRRKTVRPGQKPNPGMAASWAERV